MSWTAQPEEHYVRLTWEGTDLDAPAGLPGLVEEGKNYLLDLLSVTGFKNPSALEKLAEEHKASGQSFILVVAKSQLSKFSDEAPVVPTWQEALDFLEMEEIERQLGF